MRHVVKVMRPSDAVDDRGRPTGDATTLMEEWPCSITTLSGREVVQARTVYAEATSQVEGYGDPNKPIKETDYLTGLSLGERILNIGFVNDKLQNGVSLTLLCGERA